MENLKAETYKGCKKNTLRYKSTNIRTLKLLFVMN